MSSRLEDLYEEYEKDLIRYALSKIPGIGKMTAAFFAEDLGSIEEFLNADRTYFMTRKNRSRRKILSSKVNIDDILKIQDKIRKYKDYIMNAFGRDDVRLIYIAFLVEDIVQSIKDNILKLRLNGLDINPYLVFILNMSLEEMLKFFTYQTIGRSVVTAWGTYIEKILKVSGCELEIPPEIKDKVKQIVGKGRQPDLYKIINEDKKFALQIKRGPNSMNIDMVDSFKEVKEKFENNFEGWKLLLGLTYGNWNRISSQIKSNLKKEDIKIGRELWAFISEDQDFYKDVFVILDYLAKTLSGLEDDSKSLIDLIEDKYKEFVKEWKKTFGDRDYREVLLEEFM